MEVNEDGFLEELLSLGRETWEMAVAAGNTAAGTNPSELSSFFTTATTTTTTAATSWGFDAFDTNPSSSSASSILPGSYDCFSSTSINNNNPTLDCTFNEFYSPFEAKFAPVADLIDGSAGGSFNTKLELDTSPPSFQQEVDYSMSIVEDDEPTELMVDNNNLHNLEISEACKVEGEINNSNFSPGFSMGLCAVERKNGNKSKRVEGQPSKNLMAERRRRKRLNDRLSMLRSVVPKISKMDRTSILGDTIDYMKELLERINSLQEEIDVSSPELNGISIFKDLKSSDALVRNSPKFDVERRNADTRVEICCSGKPGLLLSTVTTLEALGLEIQQCVISCFNDFSLNASCSEELEQRTLVNSEDIKQTLFRNAGYGGRCL